MLPKMHKITQNSLLKKHGIFCLTFSAKKIAKMVLTGYFEIGYNIICIVQACTV